MSETQVLHDFSNAAWARGRVQVGEGKWRRGSGRPTQVPVNTIAPSAYPTPILPGNFFTCSGGSWSYLGGGFLTYQWYKNGVLVSGATTPQYNTTSSDLGNDFYCAVTAHNGAGTAGPVNSNTVYCAYNNPLWDVFIWDEYVWA